MISRIVRNRASDTSLDANDQRFKTFCWNGRFHYFPESFEFPSNCHASALWLRWIFGGERIVNAPLIMIEGKFLSKSNRTRLCRANYVMEAIRRISGHTFDKILAMGPVNAERLCIAFSNQLMQSFGTIDCFVFRNCPQSSGYI